MLVRQFAQPLACLRELVQNAIDAGSNHIEVEVRHLEADDCHCIQVTDTGEGMNEDIIQTQLTRLFNSAKENDLTKVGKFGIGFVSVFALEPVAVVVDTGRDGQHWRVLFHHDRTFDLIRHQGAVEGTRVEIYIPASRMPLPQLISEVESTLKFWCKHCHQPISVNGKVIQEPFELEAPVTISYQEPGTRLVAAVSLESQPFYGYYNQGLTLLEGRSGPLAAVSFKMDSRYFEHTLTRDNLIHNADYEKALALLRKVMAESYPEKLYEALRNDPARGPWKLLDGLTAIGVPPERIAAAPLWCDHQGDYYNLAQLKNCQLYFEAESSPLQQAVHQPEARILVLRMAAGDQARKRLESEGLRVEPLGSSWGVSLPQPEAELEPIRAICQRLSRVVGSGPVTPIRWLSGQARQPLLWQASKTGAIRWDLQAPARSPLLIDIGQPGFQAILDLARWSPELASQVLMQHFLLLRPENERDRLAQGLAETVLRSMQGRS